MCGGWAAELTFGVESCTLVRLVALSVDSEPRAPFKELVRFESTGAAWWPVYTAAGGACDDTTAASEHSKK